MNTKRTVIIVLILLFLTALLLLVQRGATLEKGGQRETVPLPPTSSSISIEEPRPVSPSAESKRKLTKISNEPLVGYWTSKLDGSVYGVSSDASILRLEPNLRAQRISAIRIVGEVVGAAPSPRGEMVLVEIRDGLTRSYKIFDAEKRVWRSLPDGVDAATWNQEKKDPEVLFLQSATEDGDTSYELKVLDTSRNNPRTLASNFNFLDVRLYWPTNDEIYISERPSIRGGYAYIYSIKDSTLRRVASSGAGLWLSWGPDGSTLAYESNVGLIGTTGKGLEIKLPKNTTPDKCAPYKEGYICAVPQEIYGEGEMPMAYLAGAKTSNDSIVLVRADEQSRVLWAAEDNSLEVNATELRVIDDSIYLINRYDNSLYRFTL